MRRIMPSLVNTEARPYQTLSSSDLKPMSDTPTTVTEALDRFVERFLALYADQQPPYPQQSYDNEWPSPCYINPGKEGEPCGWQPVQQQQTHPLFAGLENALETEIHPDLASYFNRYWSDPLPARCADGDLSLLFVWNEEDFERLRGNMIGHALMKKKRRQPLTLFFACTEPEELVISIENHSGHVVLEAPGKKPHRTLANSMTEFLLQLSPRMLT